MEQGLKGEPSLNRLAGLGGVDGPFVILGSRGAGDSGGVEAREQQA
jgi:hypothetical protein